MLEIVPVVVVVSKEWPHISMSTLCCETFFLNMTIKQANFQPKAEHPNVPTYTVLCGDSLADKTAVSIILFLFFLFSLGKSNFTQQFLLKEEVL